MLTSRNPKWKLALAICFAGLAAGCTPSGPDTATDDEATAEASASRCDRACLDGLVKRYLASLIAHDPGQLPLAANLRFTEDGKDLKPGEGFWSTATALRQHRLNVLDEEWSTAAGLAVMEENGAPALLAYRLKVQNGELIEIETMVVHRGGERELINRENLLVPRAEFEVPVPAEQRETRAELIRISQFYPDGLKAGSFVAVDAPFAQGARRMENGTVLAGPDCTFNANCKDMKTQPSPTRPTLRQRLLAVDEELGITFYWIAWEQQSGKTLIVWEGFKVYGGLIHAVDAFIEHGDPAIDSGWQ